ncbi:hypothetical protein L2E82_37423 [Cichorium intybus]|uniref:Uncharacterized protein n=1 Tax=Cichorium intybus TaxID=13427 RepID=A0ACB9AFV7_CICIN|nr:hypothetical protein L2E82_37423 [Cichorium intybus]
MAMFSGGTEPGFEKDEVGKATFGYFNFSPEAPLTKAPQVTIILDQVKSECDASFFENIDSNGQQVFICIRAVMGGDTISLSDSSIDDEDLPTINQQFLDRLSEMPTSRQVFMRFGLIGKTMEENESMFTESDARSFRDSYNTLEIKENEIYLGIAGSILPGKLVPGGNLSDGTKLHYRCNVNPLRKLHIIVTIESVHTHFLLGCHRVMKYWIAITSFAGRTTCHGSLNFKILSQSKKMHDLAISDRGLELLPSGATKAGRTSSRDATMQRLKAESVNACVCLKMPNF